MRIHVAWCISVFLASQAALAQDKPDFSGDWILASPTDGNVNAAQAMTVRESFIRKSAQGTPLTSPVVMVSVERQFNGYSECESYTVGIISGVVTGTVSGQRQTDSVSTSWEGNTLVIDTTYSDADGYSEHKEEWSLDTARNLLLTVTDRASGTGRTANRLMYRRQPSQ